MGKAAFSHSSGAFSTTDGQIRLARGLRFGYSESARGYREFSAGFRACVGTLIGGERKILVGPALPRGMEGQQFFEAKQ